MIQFKGVSRQYKLGDETIHALNNVSLKIEEGAFVAIMGPSGSGKSTFLNLIGGLDTPDKGEVIVKKVNVNKLRDKKKAAYRNKAIGFIFQSFNLQSRYTAIENVMLPLYFAKKSYRHLPKEFSVKKEKLAKKTSAEEALKLVGLENKLKHKPSQLSGGEQQRVAIARALINNPSILLADEPTGNLDTKNGKIIMQLLKKLNKEKNITVIMVTHDPEMAKAADYTIKIKDGKTT